MQFEFDLSKSVANKLKHGISFEDAQEIWSDEDCLEIQVAHEGEQRVIVIGSIGDKTWTAVITYRGNAIRLISVRRARKKEVTLYAQNN